MDPARNANLTSQDDGKVLFDAPQDDAESLFKIHLIVAWFSHKILSVSKGVSC